MRMSGTMHSPTKQDAKRPRLSAEKFGLEEIIVGIFAVYEIKE